ncbi:MAG: bifunctional alpha,alpha-trehalose-phosphate synthase (UDP-forming)/trehalose-phosphatase [Armatimonadota bacterium]|nr:bifunctional alpha,alpha-trehalose-phosphate synthase (UDP-forming)/trehalose-phosphatase [Armatimonadota bacterium]
MRLLVVSNRLPVTVVEREGKLRFQASAGGLVSGLSAYLDSLRESPFTQQEYIWVGWPGIAVPEGDRGWLRSSLLERSRAYPVFLSEEEMEKFYLGFCNRTIWPLFHYFPSYAVYEEELWNHYKRVNEKFCEAVVEILGPEDVVWVHDYHLMLLPKLLRERAPGVPIGFFLHIPFPSFELFRLLPSRWRGEILEGLLGADLIGFHTHEYTYDFLRCVLRFLGYTHTMGRIAVGDRLVQAGTFPMGIHFQRFFEAGERPEVQMERGKLKERLGGLKVILSVDRLDYSKGVLNRLQGYERFLERNPRWHGKVVLLMVVVPSRVGVEHYRRTKRQIDELVGKINGRFGTIGWAPIMYQYTYLPFHSLAALYTASDIALVTPLRDGMNLIAKEYVASRRDGGGVLILSETAGAAHELREAILINPTHVEEIATAIGEALEMPEEEQIRRIQVMQERLKRYDVVRWASDFLHSLLTFHREQARFQARSLDPQEKAQVVRAYHGAQRRVLFLDYDGTLVPYTGDPSQARPPGELLALLQELSRDPRNQVVLTSGRDRETLDRWFGTLDVALVAEHGVWIKERGEGWRLLSPVTNDWKPHLLSLLHSYAEYVPGAFVEEKEYALAWHYRLADPEVASMRAKELIDTLLRATTHVDVQVLHGNKVVEVRPIGVDKGRAALYFLHKTPSDFILAMGDDRADEDLFASLPQEAFTIRVGLAPSQAKFSLRDPSEAQNLLAHLTALSPGHLPL